MSEKNTIKLQTGSIKQVPLRIYPNDFTFKVNNVDFHTTKIVADLLSSKLSRYHQNDPSINEITINTRSKGSFENILNLTKFDKQEIPESEIPFVSEIFEALETQNIDINHKEEQINVHNVISILTKHEKFKYFYSDQIATEIDFISKNFSELNNNQKDELFNLSFETIESILNNENLLLSNEDELLKFINELTTKDSEYSNLYKFVLFENVESSTIREFLSIFDINDLTSEIWLRISNRLQQELSSNSNEKSAKENMNKRYKTGNQKEKKNYKEFKYQNNDFEGIINYLQKQSNIKDEINITQSDIWIHDPNNIIQYDSNDWFGVRNVDNGAWICFEFKKHKIIPTHYTIKTAKGKSEILKSWVIEVSENGEEWEKIDEQNNCSILKEKQTHTFQINKEKETKFIRLRQTGTNWLGDSFLAVCSIEIYGKLL